MNFCYLFALPDIPFRRMRRALLSVLVQSSLYCEGLMDWTGPSLSTRKKSGIYQCPGHKRWTELIDRKSTRRAMLLLQSLTPMTRTLQSVTVAGIFALVTIVLLPRMRSETYVLHDSCSADSLWTLHALDPLYMLSQSVLGNVFIIKHGCSITKYISR